MKRSGIIALGIVIVISLQSCAPSYRLNEDYLIRSPDADGYGYTKKEVDELHIKLMNTEFPKPAGYVRSMLSKDAHVGLMASITDFIISDDGVISVYVLTHKLNDKYGLVIYQEHYAEGKSPVDTDVADSDAEIVRIRR
ncbi:hypothetical protein [Persicirhabdus sediminis]|nr:hypothetical protein [Persicirhabdus sediminis]